MKCDGAHYVRPRGLDTLEKGTISIWIRPEQNPEQIIAVLNTDGWQRSACHLQVFDGRAQFSVANAVEIRSEARPGYQFDEWQHLVAQPRGSTGTKVTSKWADNLPEFNPERGAGRPHGPSRDQPP